MSWGGGGWDEYYYHARSSRIYELDIVGRMDKYGRTPLVATIHKALEGMDAFWYSYQKIVVILFTIMTSRPKKSTIHTNNHNDTTTNSPLHHICFNYIQKDTGRYLLHIVCAEGLHWAGIKDIMNASLFVLARHTRPNLQCIPLHAMCRLIDNVHREEIPKTTITISTMLSQSQYLSVIYDVLRAKPDILQMCHKEYPRACIKLTWFQLLWAIFIWFHIWCWGIIFFIPW